MGYISQAHTNTHDTLRFSTWHSEAHAAEANREKKDNNGAHISKIE